MEQAPPTPIPHQADSPIAGKLTRLWRDKDGRRVPREDVKETLIELDQRGYLLGIIANTITETEIPDWMLEDEVSHYFKAVVLSSRLGIPKPDPDIYRLAAQVASRLKRVLMSAITRCVMWKVPARRISA